jgi:alanyl-tRNA synthetase
MTSTNEIRSAFLDFFKRNGHEVVRSAPLVPHNDPTLLFVNAGMVPFKNVFTGAETRPYTRASSSQKCVRAGGKHNDLDNVGYTYRHHTFFEMLGNFSFGDYFKEDAIEFAWTLLHKEFGLSKDRLYVTVFHEDDDAHALWRKISGLPNDRIIRISTSDNFWSMGPTGPCGPCSEIFWDHGDTLQGRPPSDQGGEGDRFVEIWNLVFMQYDQKSEDERVPLARPGIDTGMGIERIAAVLQGVHDNYETDQFRTLITASEEATGVRAEGEHRASHRVIADHLRSSVFLIADGVLPSNEGRGYVLRRIMRRAMRHAHMLGAKDPLMHKLVPVLAGLMGQAYPELIRAEALATETLRQEEIRFRITLDRGLSLLEDEVTKLGEGQTLAGDVAFKLYDTFGFPVDLTQDVLRGQGRAVDMKGFEAAMAKQKAEARAAWAGSGDAATDTVWFQIREAKGATEFLGYGTTRADGRIDALVKDATEVKSVKTGDEVAIVVNQTPFYGESGGQMGDVGTIRLGNAEAEVTDTQKKLGDLIVHLAKVTKGSFKLGDVVELDVDGERRDKLRANHSATHLLHKALRSVLGEHVTQKGSLVAPDRLRFDFSHPKPVTEAEREVIEAQVNAEIRHNTDVTTRIMTPDEAVAQGALALFGEKYGDEVRVVSMGGEPHEGAAYSTELCGGTHVRRTGDISLLHIVGEGAVSSGVRRIEALTGDAARRYLLAQEHQLRDAAQTLKIAPDQVTARVAALQDERKKLEREVSELRRQVALGGSAGANGQSHSGPEPKDIGGIKVLAQRLDGIPAKELRGLIDDAKGRIKSGIVAMIAINEGKAAIAVGVTDDLTGAYNAVDLVKRGSAVLGGSGGGGRADMAQAGGPDIDKAGEALTAIENAVVELAKAS